MLAKWGNRHCEACQCEQSTADSTIVQCKVGKVRVVQHQTDTRKLKEEINMLKEENEHLPLREKMLKLENKRLNNELIW